MPRYIDTAEAIGGYGDKPRSEHASSPYEYAQAFRLVCRLGSARRVVAYLTHRGLAASRVRGGVWYADLPDGSRLRIDEASDFCEAVYPEYETHGEYVARLTARSAS